MQAPQRIAELLLKYLQNELTAGEAAELERWRSASDRNESLFHKLTDKENIQSMMKNFYHDKESVWNKLTAKAPELRAAPVRVIQWWRPMIAASVLLLIASMLFIWFYQPAKSLNDTATHPVQLINDIAPGGNRATLTLANDSVIILDGIKNGSLAEQGNSKVSKPDSGKITYIPGTDPEHSEGSATLAVQFNTLTTPRGGQFQVQLPDGTMVWLNAASSLKFPTAFRGKTREVSLQGEAYFEVAKNAAMPFKVMLAGNTEVNVLGTHFNIMAYADEATIATTLLEGSVKVSRKSVSTFIKPGEQAKVNINSGSIDIIRDTDVDQFIAWKNGMTIFKNADLRSIMRTLSRWYDVEVIYERDISAKTYAGGIPRNTNLSEVLKVLELNKIHCKIEGKRITVMP